MIGSDQQAAAHFFKCGNNTPKPGIHRFNRAGCGGKAAGMAHHICIGVIQHNQIMDAAFDRRHGFVGQLGRRHLGLQIIGRDILGRWHHDAFFAGIDRFFSAIQEEGDMGVFFGLRHA